MTYGLRVGMDSQFDALCSGGAMGACQGDLCRLLAYQHALVCQDRRRRLATGRVLALVRGDRKEEIQNRMGRRGEF